MQVTVVVPSIFGIKLVVIPPTVAVSPSSSTEKVRSTVAWPASFVVLLEALNVPESVLKSIISPCTGIPLSVNVAVITQGGILLLFHRPKKIS